LLSSTIIATICRCWVRSTNSDSKVTCSEITTLNRDHLSTRNITSRASKRSILSRRGLTNCRASSNYITNSCNATSISKTKACSRSVTPNTSKTRKRRILALVAVVCLITSQRTFTCSGYVALVYKSITGRGAILASSERRAYTPYATGVGKTGTTFVRSRT